jgi:hypothetical protein
MFMNAVTEDDQAIAFDGNAHFEPRRISGENQRARIVGRELPGMS